MKSKSNDTYENKDIYIQNPKRTSDNVIIQKLTTSSWPFTINNDFDKLAYNTKIIRPKLRLNT